MSYWCARCDEGKPNIEEIVIYPLARPKPIPNRMGYFELNQEDNAGIGVCTEAFTRLFGALLKPGEVRKVRVKLGVIE